MINNVIAFVPPTNDYYTVPGIIISVCIYEVYSKIFRVGRCGDKTRGASCTSQRRRYRNVKQAGVGTRESPIIMDDRDEGSRDTRTRRRSRTVSWDHSVRSDGTTSFRSTVQVGSSSFFLIFYALQYPLNLVFRTTTTRHAVQRPQISSANE